MLVFNCIIVLMAPYFLKSYEKCVQENTKKHAYSLVNLNNKLYKTMLKWIFPVGFTQTSSHNESWKTFVRSHVTMFQTSYL